MLINLNLILCCKTEFENYFELTTDIKQRQIIPKKCFFFSLEKYYNMIPSFGM